MSTEHSAASRKYDLNKLVRLGVLTAIEIIMAFTPLGFLRMGGLIEISLLTIPIILGAILLGPGEGAFLGAVFGTASFIQCFGISAFGMFLMGLNPLLTFLLCMVPRVLMGLLTGLIFKTLRAIKPTRNAAYPAASISAALLNTILFTILLMLFFGNSAAFRDFVGFKSAFTFIVGLVGLNGVLEAVICLVFGFAIGRIVLAIDRRNAKKTGAAAGADDTPPAKL